MSAVPTSAPENISVREFARRDGCDEKLVRKAIQTGHLLADPAGKISAELVGTGWRLGNRRGADSSADTGADSGEKVGTVRTPSISTPQPEEDDLPPLAESERKKEFYLAELRKLEYDALAEKAVLVEDVEELVGQMFAVVRTGYLNLPTQMAPRLVGKTMPQIASMLTDRVYSILTELAETDVIVERVKRVGRARR